MHPKAYFGMVVQKKIGLDRNEYGINRRIVQISATAAWCVGQYAGLLRVVSGFDAALGFGFILNVLGFSKCKPGWG